MTKPRPRRSAASLEQRRLRIMAMAMALDSLKPLGTSTAPGERADISHLVAPALASP